MPTISAGASGSYTFAQNEQALISPTQGEACQLTVLRSGVVIDSRRVTTEKVIGPFSAGGVMTLTAQRGAVDYTVSAGVESFAVVAQGGASAGYSFVVDGSLMAVSEASPYVTPTASTGSSAFSGACELAGWYCSVAAGTITIYDALSATGAAIVPATTLAVGPMPIMGAGTTGKIALTTGCWVVLSGAATVRVLVA